MVWATRNNNETQEDGSRSERTFEPRGIIIRTQRPDPTCELAIVHLFLSR